MNAMPDWSQLDDRQLIGAYCLLMSALKDRGIVRSANNPVADYTETLVCKALGLTQETSQSQAGYDAIEPASGRRYQIKGRRLTAHNTSTQLSALRNLHERPFDLLAAVAYDQNMDVLYAALIPVDVAIELSRYTAHTNSHILMFRRSLLDDQRVTDITDALRLA